MAKQTSLENNISYLLSVFYSIPCVEYEAGFVLFIVAMKIAIIFLPVFIIIFTILQKLNIVPATDLAELKAPKIDIDSGTFDFLPKIDFDRLWLYLSISILVLVFLIITGCLCHRFCFKTFVVFFGVAPIVATGAWLFYLYYEKSGGGAVPLVIGVGALSFVMMMIIEGLLFYWLYHKLKPEKKKLGQLPGPGQWV